MTKKLMMGGVLGGGILFIWSVLSWIVLPWHNMTLHKFTNEAAIMQTIQANVSQSGIYFLPSEQTNTKGPLVFASVYLKGMPSSMIPAILIELITLIIAAFLVTWMLTKATGLSYLQRIGFVLVFALTAGIMTDIPYWNWFHFDTNYTLVALADQLIGWFLAGLLLARITRSQAN